ncbi:MAG: hypothetical protein MUC55_06215 [Burkholderiales bacterium]|jgi:hypothetical protein|nr:hypothetical protein [Burkholderiales bacterium]
MKLLAAVVTLAALVAAPAGAAVMDDFIVFDRSYIPALALTNQPQKPQAAIDESMKRLDAAWAKLLAALPASEKADPVYAAAIARSEKGIKEAQRLSREGARAAAHGALEEVRVAFWEARTQKGVDFYQDRMTAFHETMEAFTDLAAKPDADAKKLRALLDESSSLWRKVETAQFDAARFGFDADRTARLQGLVKKERDVLAQLDAALEAGDRAKLAEGAKALKGTFSQAYLLFGDFDGL